MSNYPAGAQYDPAAPWNEKPRRKVWQAWYVFVEGKPGNDETHQYEVFFPDHVEGREVGYLAKDWCIGKGYVYLDVDLAPDADLPVINTEEYYE